MSAARCARSNCKRAGHKLPGSSVLMCLAHHVSAEKKPKYGNRPEYSSMVARRFDSAAERRYCETLALMEKAGEIQGLRFQQTFKLEVNGRLVCSYRADASYTDKKGVFRVIDVKGMRTQLFDLKAKLFRAVMGYDIEVVYPEKERRKR